MVTGSGTEVFDILDTTKRSPDLILTLGSGDFDTRLLGLSTTMNLPESPSPEELLNYLNIYKNPIITLHDCELDVPNSIYSKYDFFRGSPALISQDWYPELEGDDFLDKMWGDRDYYNHIGSVIYKVKDGGVSLRSNCILENSVKVSNLFSDFNQLKERNHTLYMKLWKEFFKFEFNSY